MTTQQLPHPNKKVTRLSLSDLYINRELSWLEFNARVLDEALQDDTPLLEKLKFLSIFASNLDEFFMVRVAGLMKMEAEGLRVTESPDRTETAVVLSQVRERTKKLTATQYACLQDQVLPELARESIRLAKVSELTPAQRKDVDDYFEQEVFPVLTPLAYDPAHPFPFLANQGLYLVVVPEDPDLSADLGMSAMGFVEIPSVIPRIIPVKTKTKGQVRFILVEDLIGAHLSSLFFGFGIKNSYMIRIIRNLDYNLLENKVVDLLKTVQKQVINREHQEVVRLEVQSGMHQEVLDVLTSNLGVSGQNVYEIPGPLFLPGLMGLYGIDRPDLKDPPFNPRLPLAMAGTDDIFSLIGNGDILVHHPYESFYAVTEFITSAANDPNVVAIKQTLYRTAGDSPIIQALIDAAENGKQVTAVVELKARFDEKNNITWARRLERVGVNVVFGCVGLKTHGKATLIIRREKAKLKRYVHIATGNYNSHTAKLYTDIGLFTDNEEIGSDVSSLFNLITGFDILTGGSKVRNRAKLPKMEKLSFAPTNLKATFIKLIYEEMDHCRKHGSGLIMAKLNAIVDRDIIDALYKASQAGVTIKLIVRGICCLRPGIPGVSENIHVISIVDRFLEHARIYYFQAAGEKKVFIGSADWMPRNMDRRIEILCPVEDKTIKERLINEILATSWMDNVKARELKVDGSYVRRQPGPEEERCRSQLRFIEIAREDGIKSIPYEIAIRHNLLRKGERPVAKKGKKKE